MDRYWQAAPARAESTRDAAESRREGSRLIDTGFLVFERNRLLPASVLMGALAARLVIFVIPLFVLVIFFIGLYADASATSPSEAARQAGMAGLFAQAADDSTTMSNGVRVTAVIATIFATLYAANGLGRLVRRTHALVWRVPYTPTPRPWALPFVVVAVSAVGLILISMGAWSERWPEALRVGEIVLEFLAVGVVWLVISRYLPHDPDAKSWWDFAPGALLAALGVVALRLAMVLYFAPRSVAWEERYGSVAIALVLLSWAYWLGFMIVGSADLNAAAFRSRRRG